MQQRNTGTQRFINVIIPTSLILLFINLSLIPEVVRAQWQPDQRLTNDTATSKLADGMQRRITADGNTVRIVWSDSRDGNNEIYYKQSTDGGRHWAEDMRLTKDTSESDFPSIAVSGATVHVLWVDFRGENFDKYVNRAEIYYKRSSDGGNTWGDDVRLSYDSLISHESSIAASGPVVHVVWNVYTNPLVDLLLWYNRSTDGGTHWEKAKLLTDKSKFTVHPSIAASGDTLHLVWCDNRDGNYEIYYRRAIGGVWENETRLTNDKSISYMPSISVDGTGVSVVWYDSRDGNREIYYKGSTDGGSQWSDDMRLTDNSGSSRYSAVARSGPVVHVVWQDERNGNPEIFYKRSTDAGLTWEADILLADNQGTSSEYPAVAALDSTVHIAWRDMRDGPSGEIYYKRNPTGNIAGIPSAVSSLPQQFSYVNSYPNPCASYTTIRYSLTSNCRVVVTVHDLLGRFVARLFDGYRTAGTYELPFDVSALPAGLYYSRVEAAGSVVNSLMTVMK